ncbi:hypothetical protein METBIDRAFT_11827 [Metschnikowia bicuspidata var. bicuspidata NRRL YB-4993]|uniref:DASH complex subunit DAM1 n=1 Tax=Metschnikowia bicuspidata var. bicuspidata NRRL YB-4993 TaxID=869754 RepID=A0A1A0HB93_9ASCO|nr:hypothetical protein METBIDRAFT_11827 [Metschnikowia bicuspidata var. bicuspidata NRRL YB-4993]OBA21281.1 hypothetical protein METBIDRAFT_11827 [Metschnikowia bicuspidata var. bicuspidata NRRL YB-4993]
MHPHTPTGRLQALRRKLLRSSGVFRAIGPIAASPNVHYPKEIRPLEAPENRARLAAMADAFAALQQNMEGLAATHSAVNSFNESFASLFLGLQVHMFCNSFPGIPAREQYEAMEQKQSSEQKNAGLRAKVDAARRRNADLKRQASQQAAATRSRPHLGDLFSQRPLSRQRAAATAPKIPVARDDSFSATDTFIEAPGHSQPPPNLDQQPRYMRGLFEIPGAANTRRYDAARSGQKPSGKNTMNVPARARSRDAAAPPSTQKTASAAPHTSARQRASLAAQKAQKARAARMSSRPPFR